MQNELDFNHLDSSFELNNLSDYQKNYIMDILKKNHHSSRTNLILTYAEKFTVYYIKDDGVLELRAHTPSPLIDYFSFMMPVTEQTMGEQFYVLYQITNSEPEPEPEPEPELV